MEVLMVILGLSFTFFIWICRGCSTVLYGCSLYGFSLLRESLVTGQSCNLPLRLDEEFLDQRQINDSYSWDAVQTLAAKGGVGQLFRFWWNVLLRRTYQILLIHHRICGVCRN